MFAMTAPPLTPETVIFRGGRIVWVCVCVYVPPARTVEINNKPRGVQTIILLLLRITYC